MNNLKEVIKLTIRQSEEEEDDNNDGHFNNKNKFIFIITLQVLVCYFYRFT